jgi:hypothetical protein
MNAKQSCVSRKLRCWFGVSAALVVVSCSAQGGGTNQFVGSQSCSSSSCHGGASPKNNQNLIWSQQDPHAKSYATLTSARSERLAEALNIKNATTSSRCTVCHAPLTTVPKEMAAVVLDPVEGVSCENCHGPAKNWLRSHTRTDLTHADKVANGMRDLRNLYGRANACVACHQNVDAEILAAGHPELIFELDGQAVSEHKHWHEQTNWSGAQAWLVGQAVAMREISWQLEKAKAAATTNAASIQDRWMGMALMFQALGEIAPGVDGSVFLTHNRWGPSSARQHADEIARKASALGWTPMLSRSCLSRVTGQSNNFRGYDTPAVKAHYAERLVLALDRLLVADHSKDAGTSAALDRLFKLAQSVPDFDPKQFAVALDDLAKRLK